MATVPRPLLPREDRDRLRGLAEKAERHKQERTFDPAYAQGVADVLRWLASNEDMTPLLQEVTR